MKIKNLLFTVLAVSFLFSVTGHAQVDGIVSSWKFEEGSGETVTDDITGATGQIFGTGVAWVDGVSGMAIDFTNADDTAIIIVEETDPLKVINFTDQSFSVSVWVKIDPSGGEQDVMMKGDNGTDGPNGNGNRYTIHTKEGQVRIAIDDNVNKSQLDAVDAEYPVNEWAHLVGMRDVTSGMLYMYVNGEQIGFTADNTGAINIEGQRLIIGNYHTLGSPMRGPMDELLIINRALAANEVVDLYNSYSSTGIFNAKASVGALHIFPNLVSAELNLKDVAAITNIEIYNLAGTLVKTIENSRNNQVKVDVADLPMGKYIVKGFGENGVSAGSFIKK